MKSFLILSLLCQVEDMGSVKIHIHEKKQNKMDMVELYNPGGLGENFLDTSYVPNYSKYKKIKHSSDRHELVYIAKLPMNGSVSASIDLERGIALGSIRFPGANDQFYFLDDCSVIEPELEKSGD